MKQELLTPMPGLWVRTNRGDQEARVIADRHYNRQKVGSPQFVKPGRCLVLKRPDAVWVSSWPFAEYVRHAWAGAWECSTFRNEGPTRSSDLIRAAVRETLAFWETPPPQGMVTFVDASQVRTARPGWCYLKAGFKEVGRTKGGLLVFQLDPAALLAFGNQGRDA